MFGFAAPSTFGGVIPTPVCRVPVVKTGCVTRTSIPHHCARPRGPRSLQSAPVQEMRNSNLSFDSWRG
jgi:hypothetical protein